MNYESGSIGQEPRLALGGAEVPRRRRGWLVAAGAALLLVLAAWFFFGHKKSDGPAAQPDQAPSVSVMRPGRHSIDHVVSATGTLAARVDMPVGIAGEGGRITAVLVQPGDWVHAGQVLATVDRSVQAQTASSLAAQIRVAQADADLSQSNLARAQSLVGKGFISRADIDSKTATRDAAIARVRVAQALLAQQQATNGRLDVRAPAEGLVLTRQVEPGQVVSGASGTLFRLAKGGEMELRALVAEGDLTGMRVGASAQVTPVGSTRSFAGRVWQVSPIIDATSRQGTARVAIPFDAVLRPGGFASATITSGAADAPLLPQSAIQSDDKGNFVYVLGAGDKVERRGVTLGQASDEGVAIASGLAGTEQIVVSAGAFLNPGQRVKPVMQKAG